MDTHISLPPSTLSSIFAEEYICAWLYLQAPQLGWSTRSTTPSDTERFEMTFSRLLAATLPSTWVSVSSYRFSVSHTQSSVLWHNMSSSFEQSSLTVLLVLFLFICYRLLNWMKSQGEDHRMKASAFLSSCFSPPAFAPPPSNSWSVSQHIHC